MPEARLPVEFVPHPLLRNAHAMTLAAKFYPRGNLLENIPTEPRLFSVAPDAQLLGLCHWQARPQECGTVVLIHGLEGCTGSHYMKGVAAKAWRAGLNVIRLNQRTCGGTEHLTRSLYNGGLSGDFQTVIADLAEKDGLTDISVVGYSMGANLALKMAGEVTDTLPSLISVFGISPNIDPTKCIAALERPSNKMYHDYFLRRLKARVVKKAALFPQQWDLAPLRFIESIREFDEIYTAPDGGYRNATEYYDASGARHVLAHIRIPTVIITAQDDPFIPCAMFDMPAIRTNPFIRLVMTRYGGHCGFFQRRQENEDYYWVENRLIEFMTGQAALPV